MFDKEFEESLLELRDVLCDERIAQYCIENDIVWSDSAMTGSPIEILGTAKELIKFSFGIGGIEMTETDSLGIVGGIMTVKEVLETKVVGLIPIGECDCGCGSLQRRRKNEKR